MMEGSAMWTRSDSRMREYQALPLFAGCSRSELRQASRAATGLSLRAGTVLLRQGERRRPFVIVVGGTAEVWRDGQPIDEIGAGGYFGEMAIFRGIGQPATIIARTDMRIDVFARREFAALLADVELVRHRIEDELDHRVAKWIAANRLPLLSSPASTDNHQPAVEQPRRARFHRAGGRATALACHRRRASR
ncbi:MAG: putative transcriptional regulator [Acidimicrobiales bacterium]|nr:putative transcriptional regulator [Acidimicrobiales bacterium]